MRTRNRFGNQLTIALAFSASIGVLLAAPTASLANPAPIPQISFDKLVCYPDMDTCADSIVLSQPDQVTYLYTVFTDGPTLTDITIEDDQLGTLVSGLTIFGTPTSVLTEVFVDQTVLNVATVFYGTTPVAQDKALVTVEPGTDPIPEPSAALLYAAGLVIVGQRTRRRRSERRMR